MVLLQKINKQLFTSIPTLCIRNYATKKPKTSKMINNGNRLVHQEVLRYVNPFARINVQSDLYLRIQPADMHEYVNGDAFIAQLYGDAVKNCTATLNVEVVNDDKEVNVVVKKLIEKPNFSCDIKIPMRSELHVNCTDSVRIEGVHGNALVVDACGNISTKQIKAENIELGSETGNIKCEGTLLGKTTRIKAKDGMISLDRLQGDSLHCSTHGGGIRTNCCYVEESKFETENGCLNLKNVHKQAQVLMNNGGELTMSGFNGNLYVQAKGARMNIQLSELSGKNEIIANEPVETVINISEEIQKQTVIDITAEEIVLEPSLDDIKDALQPDKRSFRLSCAQESQQQLCIQSNGGNGILRFGKQSWTDRMRNVIGVD